MKNSKKDVRIIMSTPAIGLGGDIITTVVADFDAFKFKPKHFNGGTVTLVTENGDDVKCKISYTDFIEGSKTYTVLYFQLNPKKIKYA